MEPKMSKSAALCYLESQVQRLFEDRPSRVKEGNHEVAWYQAHQIHALCVAIRALRKEMNYED